MSRPLCNYWHCTRTTMVGLDRCYKHVGLRSTRRAGSTRPRPSSATIQLGLRLPVATRTQITVVGSKVPELLEALKRAGLVAVVCVGCGAEGLARAENSANEVGRRCPRCDAAAKLVAPPKGVA